MSYFDSGVYQCPVWRVVCMWVMKMAGMVGMSAVTAGAKMRDFMLNG